MKILIVSLYHPRVVKGGAQYVAKDLFDAASADPGVTPVLLAGIDARLFPSYTKTGAAITELPGGRDEYLLLGTVFDDFEHTVYEERRNKALRRFLEDQRPDVIHIHHSLWVGLDFIDLARAVLPEVRIVYTLHEYLPICYAKGQLYRYHERGVCQDTSPDQCVKCFPDRTQDDFILRRRGFMRAFSQVDRFVSPSDHLRGRFDEWGLPGERIEVIPNGHIRRRPEDWRPQHTAEVNVFGFFGQYIDAKGIDILFEAAALTAAETEAPIEIRVFGGNKAYATPAYLEKIEEATARMPDTVRITEVGPYDRDNIFDLMAGIDWVVVPSIWPETFVLVVSEAWDARRPVIASRVGALADRIEHGRNGLTFTAGAAAELSVLMADCLGNTELWRQLSDGVADEISMAEAWAAHRSLFESLLGEGG